MVIINGVVHSSADAALPIRDPIVLRGDGCFEATRVYGGRPFRLGDHLDRLQRSASAMSIELPPRRDIEKWAAAVAGEIDDGALRILASNGTDGPTLVVLEQPIPEMPEGFRLLPIAAPWHPAGEEWDLAGVKTLSYAPNMAANRRAAAAGYDDALLVAGDTVLELPTATIVWAVDGQLETPSLDLGILASVTRKVVLELCDELEIPIAEGRYPLTRTLGASEVMVLSSTREVRPVVGIGETPYSPGPLTKRLADGYRRKVAAELAGTA